MERYPDIEIYLAETNIEHIDAWLREVVDAEPLKPAGKRKWRSRGRDDSHDIPILLVENAADGFSSLWFDSAETPWPRDTDCARDAARALQSEVRCTLGGWQPGDDPDRFWQVLPNGSEGTIHWPDSGQ